MAELDEGSINFIKYTRNYAKEHSKSIRTRAHMSRKAAVEEGRQSGEIKVLTAYCKTEDQWDDLHMAKDYGNDYYFIRQLFEQNWTPQSTTVD